MNITNKLFGQLVLSAAFVITVIYGILALNIDVIGEHGQYSALSTIAGFILFQFIVLLLLYLVLLRGTNITEKTKWVVILGFGLFFSLLPVALIFFYYFKLRD